MCTINPMTEPTENNNIPELKIALSEEGAIENFQILLDGIVQDDVIRWWQPHTVYRDGARTALLPWVDIYIVNSHHAIPAWHVPGSPSDAPEQMLTRNFRAPSGKFLVTKSDPSQLWISHDVDLWLAQGTDKLASPAVAAISPIGSPLDPMRYQNLVTAAAGTETDEEGTFSVTGSFSLAHIADALSVWSLAFLDRQYAFLYEPAPERLPRWHKELFSRLQKTGTTEVDTLCEYMYTAQDMLQGEIPRTCGQPSQYEVVTSEERFRVCAQHVAMFRDRGQTSIVTL